jgi:hypothetical protein
VNFHRLSILDYYTWAIAGKTVYFLSWTNAIFIQRKTKLSLPASSVLPAANPLNMTFGGDGVPKRLHFRRMPTMRTVAASLKLGLIWSGLTTFLYARIPVAENDLKLPHFKP